MVSTPGRNKKAQGPPPPINQSGVMDDSGSINVSVDSKLTMKSEAGKFRKPVKINFKEADEKYFDDRDHKHIKYKLERTLKLQKDMGEKNKVYDEPRYHARNSTQELEHLAEIHKSRDATTMIH